MTNRVVGTGGIRASLIRHSFDIRHSENAVAIRILNTILLVVTVIGAVLAFRAGSEYRHWSAIHNDLAARTGSFRVVDPSRLNVRAFGDGRRDALRLVDLRASGDEYRLGRQDRS